MKTYTVNCFPSSDVLTFWVKYLPNTQLWRTTVCHWFLLVNSAHEQEASLAHNSNNLTGALSWVSLYASICSSNAFYMLLIYFFPQNIKKMWIQWLRLNKISMFSCIIKNIIKYNWPFYFLQVWDSSLSHGKAPKILPAIALYYQRRCQYTEKGHSKNLKRDSGLILKISWSY